MVEPNVAEIAVQAAQQFTGRYWRHGDDPEVQYHLAVLSMEVENLREQNEAEALERVEQLQDELARARVQLSELREMADNWKQWDDEEKAASGRPKMMYWSAAAGHIHSILGSEDE
jgi:hypothetical protein